MPALSALTDKGREMISQLPSWLRDDPDTRSVIHCYAREAERQQDALRAIRRDLIPGIATSRGLAWWEKILGLTVAPVGLDDDQRRALILGMLIQLVAGASGQQWEEALLALIGPGLSYVEESPYTVRVTLPFPPESLNYQRLERLARAFTPAHLELIFQSEVGFVLDQSQLDQEPFHPS